jgi:hypothetical protein
MAAPQRRTTRRGRRRLRGAPLRTAHASGQAITERGRSGPRSECEVSNLSLMRWAVAQQQLCETCWQSGAVIQV